MHTYIHTYTHTHIHIYMDAYIHTCIHTYTRACMQVYIQHTNQHVLLRDQKVTGYPQYMDADSIHVVRSASLGPSHIGGAGSNGRAPMDLPRPPSNQVKVCVQVLGIVAPNVGCWLSGVYMQMSSSMIYVPVSMNIRVMFKCISTHIAVPIHTCIHTFMHDHEYFSLPGDCSDSSSRAYTDSIVNIRT
jgi:hypothetical protein